MANNDRQIFGYTPQGTPIYDPVGANMGSPSSVMPAAQSMPDAMNTPWQTQGPLGGPPPAPGGGVPGGPPLNTGAPGVGNPFGFTNQQSVTDAANDPSLAVAAFNQQGGYDPNSGAAALNQRYGSNLRDVYYLLNPTASMGPNSGENFLNFSNQYLQQGNTAGGAHISEGQVLSALFTHDDKSTVYQMIYGVDSQGNKPTPDTVVKRFVGLMQSGLQGTTPDVVINAMTNLYLQAGDGYKLAVAQGYGGSFADYLTSQGLDPASMGMQ